MYAMTSGVAPGAAPLVALVGLDRTITMAAAAAAAVSDRNTTMAGLVGPANDTAAAAAAGAADAAAAAAAPAAGFAPWGAPAGLLEALIPQYSLLASVVRDVLGLDVGLVMTALAVLYGVMTAAQYLYDLGWALVDRWWISSITVRDRDDIFDHIMHWLKEQRLTTDNTRLTAETDFRVSPEEEPDTRDGFVNFDNWWRRAAPRFIPAHGRHWFRHEGRWFELGRSRGQVEETMPWGSPRSRVEETLVLSCFGRSTAPLKALLQACKESYYAQEVRVTCIHRPSGMVNSKDWDMVARRRSRPISTVVLDADEKAAVLADMDEFLRPATATWYAERGIPYRRGYLFHGPPGTGKTSLSFAAAGLFGLDVYCLSLQDPTLSEEDLMTLFADLPSRCIVLLEDVDTAGLAKRKGMAGDDDDDKAKRRKRRARRSKKKGSRPDAADSDASDSDSDSDSDNDDDDDSSSGGKKRANSISLSALLNAIDGVASHEGRILVLTTNKPQALDAALRRPGRVDRDVAFALASRAQIADLFLRMYAGVPAADAALAAEFAAALEDATWSPAEVQGFLLTRKRDPVAAVKEVGAWRTARLAEKETAKAATARKEAEKKEREAKAETAASGEPTPWTIPWIAF